MISLYKVDVSGNYPGLGRVFNYVYTGTAGSLEIAVRAAKRLIKKEGLANIKVSSVENLGQKEFGR